LQVAHPEISGGAAVLQVASNVREFRRIKRNSLVAPPTGAWTSRRHSPPQSPLRIRAVKMPSPEPSRRSRHAELHLERPR